MWPSLPLRCATVIAKMRWPFSGKVIRSLRCAGRGSLAGADADGTYGKDTSMADAPAYRTSWAKLIAKYPDLCKKSSCRYFRFEAPDPERWVPDGYVVVQARRARRWRVARAFSILFRRMKRKATRR